MSEELLKIWPSGKHKGKVIADLPYATVKAGRDLGKDPALKEACRYELTVRDKMEGMATPPTPPPIDQLLPEPNVRVIGGGNGSGASMAIKTPLAPHEIAELGTRDHTIHMVGPVVGEDKTMQAQMSPGVQALTMREQMVTSRHAQPVLTESEAISLGLQTWHRYGRNLTQFTTVISGRRFIVDQSVFERMKVGGLALEGPPAKPRIIN